MITVFGTDNTREYMAALQLRDLIVADWPEVSEDNRHNITIVAGVKCYGQAVVDIDLVVFVSMRKTYKTNLLREQKPIFVRSLCLTIEVKDHSHDHVQFEGNQVEVRYGNKPWHSATEQSFQQQISLRQYLDQQHIKPPFVTNLIWLRNVNEAALPKSTHNILGRDSTWKSFVKRVYELQHARWDYNTSTFEISASSRVDEQYIQDACSLFTKPVKMSPLDRRRVEAISRRVLKDQRYGQQMGTQLLIFRGKGGTGKTVRLLQLAFQLYDEHSSKVLMLTYNKALVADIQRLLGLMGINQRFDERNVAIRTAHSFFGQILNHLEISPEYDPTFFHSYEEYKDDLVEMLRMGALTSGDVHQMIATHPEHYYWDYIFIDEAQDWPQNERDILFKMFDYKHFVIADGVDQFVRSHMPISWSDTVAKQNHQIVRLTKSLRLKDGLCRFVQSFARQMGLDGWNVEPDPEMYGGRVVIIEGQYSSNRDIHDEIFTKHKVDGNCAVDMLICVPPRLAKKPSDNNLKQSVVGTKLVEWGYQVWDGAIEREREHFPSSLDQFRIVQYDSCRGLEGWTVINLALDEFYDYKLESFEPSPHEVNDLFFDYQQAALINAVRWSLIPLTRAIDTLVIQLSDSNHVVAHALLKVAEECADIVEWRVVSDVITGD